MDRSILVRVILALFIFHLGGCGSPTGEDGDGSLEWIPRSNGNDDFDECDNCNNALTNCADCCDVCGPNISVPDPYRSFTMKDTFTGESYDWTCGNLEMALADVRAVGGAAGEARYCGLAQTWARKECGCKGTDSSDNVYDPNPACDLCKGQDLNYVPANLENELVETGVAGRMPCGGLYHSLSEGVLSKDLCPIVQKNAGKFCCSSSAIDPGDVCEPSCRGDRCGQSDGCGGTCRDDDIGECGKCGNAPCCKPSCHGDRCGQSDGCGGTCRDDDIGECGKCGNAPCDDGDDCTDLTGLPCEYYASNGFCKHDVIRTNCCLSCNR